MIRFTSLTRGRIVALGLAAALVLTVAASSLAGTWNHNQYRKHGPTRYVVSIWEILHDGGVIKTKKRTLGDRRS